MKCAPFVGNLSLVSEEWLFTDTNMVKVKAIFGHFNAFGRSVPEQCKLTSCANSMFGPRAQHACNWKPHMHFGANQHGTKM